jgi:hypothetical protein
VLNQDRANLAVAPKWRNWQTRRTQNPVGLTPRVGSTPTFGTQGRRRAWPVEQNAVVAKLGVLTGGGDCPGLNAVIRAVARRSFQRGHEVVGVRDGWRGLVADELEPLGPREISGILPR